MKKLTKVLSFRATTELAGKIKAYAVLTDKKTLAEAVIELIEIALEIVLKNKGE